MASKRIFLFVIFGSLLTGCGKPSFEGAYLDYIDRLERVLEQEAGQLETPVYERYPTLRDVVRDVPGINIDLFEFLQLGECQLQQAVAEKNRSLGKLAPSSIALKQDIEFILLSRDCIDQLDDDDLKKALEAGLQHKRRYLSAMLWNAIFAGEEYRDFWSITAATYPHVAESKTEGALNTLISQSEIVLRQERLENFNPTAFEEALHVLRSGGAGALLDHWRTTTRSLQLATQILVSRAEARPLCFKDMRSPKAEYFRNVVLDKFVGGLQEDIAVLNQRYYAVILPTQKLESLFDDLETPTYKTYRVARDADFQRGLMEVKRHVDAIQPLMVQCGFIPAT